MSSSAESFKVNAIGYDVESTGILYESTVGTVKFDVWVAAFMSEVVTVSVAKARSTSVCMLEISSSLVSTATSSPQGGLQKSKALFWTGEPRRFYPQP